MSKVYELMEKIEELNSIFSIAENDSLNEFCEEIIAEKQELLEEINYLSKKRKTKDKKQPINHYEQKLKTKKKIEKLINEKSYFYSIKENDNDEEYYTRFYLSGCRKFAKRNSSKKVRYYQNQIPKGAYYRKIYDYWNDLF